MLLAVLSPVLLSVMLLAVRNLLAEKSVMLLVAPLLHNQNRITMAIPTLIFTRKVRE
jgi:hypothetical protein